VARTIFGGSPEAAENYQLSAGPPKIVLIFDCPFPASKSRRKLAKSRRKLPVFGGSRLFSAVFGRRKYLDFL